MRRWFWKIRYWLYRGDLYPGLKAGRGSHDNPLTMDDLAPVMRALRRIK